jgi:hypothetical protein
MARRQLLFDAADLADRRPELCCIRDIAVMTRHCNLTLRYLTVKPKNDYPHGVRVRCAVRSITVGDRQRRVGARNAPATIQIATCDMNHVPEVRNQVRRSVFIRVSAE